MSLKALTVGFAALVLAVPAAAQQRGTIELGAFGSYARFDHKLSLTTAYGGGGRMTAFLDPRWAIEFEQGEMKGSRPDGLNAVNVGILSGRLMYVPMRSRRFSGLLGLGAGLSTETNFLHTYGLDFLAGFKWDLNQSAAIRVDGTWDFLANEQWKSYQIVRMGLSLTRNPFRMRGVRTQLRGVTMYAYSDSVAAAEIRRLRERDAALSNLRDSLANAPIGATQAKLAADLATMEAQIHFAFDKSDLTDSAKTLLDQKARVFKDNPNMMIVMLGYTDVTGTDAYNMGLGARRAKRAKDYLVAQGIAPDRIVIESKGERRQIANSAGVEGEALNRRAIFRLLIAPDVIEQK